MLITNSDEIIGVGRLNFVSKKKSQIRYMAVDRKYRQKGLGKSIVKALESYSSNNQRNHITLNVNEAAILFYSRLGCRNIDEIDTRIKIKHFKMEKS